jgi:hypothetical protein
MAPTNQGKNLKKQQKKMFKKFQNKNDDIKT